MQPDMGLWTGRVDPEPRTERWHQVVAPLGQRRIGAFRTWPRFVHIEPLCVAVARRTLLEMHLAAVGMNQAQERERDR